MLTEGSFQQFSSSAIGQTALGHALEAMEPSLSFFIDQHKDQPSELDVSIRLMDGAFVTRQYMAGMSTLRQKQHIARDGNHDLLLFIAQNGQPFHMKSPDRPHGRDEFTIRPGESGLLVGNDEQFDIQFRGCSTIGISVPRVRVIAAIGDLDAAFYNGVPQSAALKLLTGFAQMLASDIGSFVSAIALHTRETLTDLFILALGPTRDAAEAAKDSAAVARLTRIKADIGANIGNAELSLDWLARRHSLRPRAIQDLFYAAGEGFTEYVRNTRLDHAHRLLSDPRHAHRNIAEIALSSGFGDISWFNNGFRKRFGMTPSEARLAAAIARSGGT